VTKLQVHQMPMHLMVAIAFLMRCSIEQNLLAPQVVQQ
jgi:hypothetical protein